MVGEKSPLSIIPSEFFHWRPRVQFIDSFRTRDSAVKYALKHGYNLIVERREGAEVLFDVLLDIDEACIEGLSLELTHTEEVLIEPDAHGATMPDVSAAWRACKRSATALASQRFWTDARRGIHGIWSKHLYRRGLNLRNQVVPFTRRVASRFWWSGSALAFRRWQRRHSHGTTADLAKRFAACLDGFYAREVSPRLRQLVEEYRQADVKGALRRAWNSPFTTFSTFAARFAAAAAVFLNPEVAPFVLQAASNLRRAHIARGFPRNAEPVGASSSTNTTQLG